jgi:hypothetical protein
MEAEDEYDEQPYIHCASVFWVVDVFFQGRFHAANVAKML